MKTSCSFCMIVIVAALLTTSCAVFTSDSSGSKRVALFDGLDDRQRRAIARRLRTRLVAPDEVPPLRPEYLPSPYTWQVYQQNRNPNNPYNLIDDARQVRGMDAPQPGQGGEQADHHRQDPYEFHIPSRVRRP